MWPAFRPHFTIYFRLRFADTRYAVYLTTLLSFLCVFIDSAQTLSTALPISKKWFALLFLTLLFCYVYLRPLIRQRLGSASSATINWSFVYAVWLVSSLFYHFPPLDKLGFDIKADVSISLTIFLMSCVVLGGILGALSFANQARMSTREVIGIVVMNSMTLAMACSTYFSFCGAEGILDRRAEVPAVKQYVCGGLLRPLDVQRYRSWQAYVMYDEKTNAISPVFTTWVTIFVLFLCNSASDYAAKVVCTNAWREMRRRRELGRASKGAEDGRSVGAENSFGMSMRIPRSIAALFGDLGDSFGTPRGSRAVAKPKFLPMFPWYSGTSADLLNTLFNLTVSVKFFVGRFDMRTLLGAMRAKDGSRDHGRLPYEDFGEKDEFWFDFCADTGDGGNSTYSVARCLAAPEIAIEGGQVLPRGEILVHGGDLAYPHPTDEVYEERLFSVYNQAFPASDPNGILVPLKKNRPASSSSEHPPKAYMIPGNHDWIDGLDTFTKHVLHRSSIGGWQLPQDMPYFALKLPHNWWLLGLDLALEEDMDMVQYGYFARLAEEKMGPNGKVIIVTHCPPWLIDWFFGVDKRAHKLLRQLITGPLRGRTRLRLAGDLHFYLRHQFHRYDDGDVSCTPYEPTPAGGSPGFGGESPMGGSPVFFGRSPVLDEDELRKKLLGVYDAGKATGNGFTPALHPEGKSSDHVGVVPAEHLVVCGGGGAFLHPTHVFVPSRFRDRESRLPGEYRCVGAFPSAQDSQKICRRNLHAFRHVNSTFDVIGGAIYYVLIVSALPCCSQVSEVFEASSLLSGLGAFGRAMCSTIIDIFARSRISLIAFLLLFGIAFAFARGGGIGAVKGVPPRARGTSPEYKGYPLGVRIRLGGVFTQLMFAFAHAMLHLSAAVALLLVLEMGIETVIRFEGVGSNGYHSLFTWYQSFEAERFPDPADMRRILSTYTLGLYPNAIKWAMALFDVPEAIAVARNAVCADGGSISQLGRLESSGYFGGMLVYFWVLATPTVAFLFGLYLYVSANWLHVHYDEAFSALQVEDRKSFLKLHIDRDGKLTVYALGLREVPKDWSQDPLWTAPGGGGCGDATGSVEAHRCRVPSRWIPVDGPPPEDCLQVVDKFCLG